MRAETRTNIGAGAGSAAATAIGTTAGAPSREASEARAVLEDLLVRSGATPGAYRSDVYARLISLDPAYALDTIRPEQFPSARSLVPAIYAWATAMATSYAAHPPGVDAMRERAAEFKGHEWLQITGLAGVLIGSTDRGLELVRAQLGGDSLDQRTLEALRDACRADSRVLAALERKMPDVYAELAPHLRPHDVNFRRLPERTVGSLRLAQDRWTTGHHNSGGENYWSSTSYIAFDAGYTAYEGSSRGVDLLMADLKHLQRRPDRLTRYFAAEIAMDAIQTLRLFESPAHVPPLMSKFLSAMLAHDEIREQIARRTSDTVLRIVPDDGSPASAGDVIARYSLARQDFVHLAKRLEPKILPDAEKELRSGLFRHIPPPVIRLANEWAAHGMHTLMKHDELAASFCEFATRRASDELLGLLMPAKEFAQGARTVKPEHLARTGINEVLEVLGQRNLDFGAAAARLIRPVQGSYGGDRNEYAHRDAILRHRHPEPQEIWSAIESRARTPTWWVHQMVGGHKPAYESLTAVVDNDPKRFAAWLEQRYFPELLGSKHLNAYDVTVSLRMLARLSDADRDAAVRLLRVALEKPEYRTHAHRGNDDRGSSELVDIAYARVRVVRGRNPELEKMHEGSAPRTIDAPATNGWIFFERSPASSNPVIAEARTFIEGVVATHLPPETVRRAVNADPRERDSVARAAERFALALQSEAADPDGASIEAIGKGLSILREWGSGKIDPHQAVTGLVAAGVVRTPDASDRMEPRVARHMAFLLGVMDRFSENRTGRSIVPGSVRAPDKKALAERVCGFLASIGEATFVAAAEEYRREEEAKALKAKVADHLRELLAQLEGREAQPRWPSRQPVPPTERLPKRDEAPMAWLEWAPQGDSRYMTLGLHGRMERRSCAHVPLDGPAVRQFFEQLVPHHQTVPTRPMKIRLDNVANGCSIPIPWGAAPRLESLRCTLPGASLERNDDGTYRLRCGVHPTSKSHLSTGALEFIADVPTADRPRGNATIAEIRAAACALCGGEPQQTWWERFRGLPPKYPEPVAALLEPFTEWSDLPRDLQNVVKRAKSAPSAVESIRIIREAVHKFKYDMDLVNDPSYHEMLGEIRDGTLTSKAYFATLHRRRGGICGDLSSVEVDLLRHAGLPTAWVNGAVTDEKVILPKYLHAYAAPLLMDSNGRLHFAVEEAVGGGLTFAIELRREKAGGADSDGDELDVRFDDEIEEGHDTPGGISGSVGVSFNAADSPQELPASSPTRNLWCEFRDEVLTYLRLFELGNHPAESRAVYELSRAAFEVDRGPRPHTLAPDEQLTAVAAAWQRNLEAESPWRSTFDTADAHSFLGWASTRALMRRCLDGEIGRQLSPVQSDALRNLMQLLDEDPRLAQPAGS